MKGKKLYKNGELLYGKNIVKYDKNKYVYIPVSELNVNINDKVKIGTIIGKYRDLNVYSSVSGIVTGFEEKKTIYGNLNTIIIENDFNETTEIKNVNINNKESFIKLLNDSSIVGLGGAGFPTYKKYDSSEIKTLIINAVECEPFIMSDYIVSITYAKEIIDTIYKIMKINNIEKTYIGVKKKNKKIINALKKFIIDKKINIVLTPDFYPMGWEKNLVLLATHQTYDKLPIEKGIVVSNISTIYSIYNALNGKVLTSKVITINGDMVVNPINIEVKVGTLVKDILKEVKLKDGKYDIIFGGPMMGKKVDYDYVIAPTVNCILIMEYKECKEINCLRCGKCINVCPVKIDPVLIKDSINNIEKIKKLNSSKCIECGLCSYICPSNIPLRDYVISAKEKIRKEKV